MTPPDDDHAPEDDFRPFREQFVEFVRAHQARLRRVLVRLSGDSELAGDLVQEAFMSLMQRGSMPDTPEAWVITVALNRLRNERAKSGRRARLLEEVTELGVAVSPATLSDEAKARSARRNVRAALEELAERDVQLLVLRSEGYSYRDIANALGLHEASVGTLLARARRAFLAAYEGHDASR